MDYTVRLNKKVWAKNKLIFMEIDYLLCLLSIKSLTPMTIISLLQPKPIKEDMKTRLHIAN